MKRFILGLMVGISLGLMIVAFADNFLIEQETNSIIYGTVNSIQYKNFTINLSDCIKDDVKTITIHREYGKDIVIETEELNNADAVQIIKHNHGDLLWDVK